MKNLHLLFLAMSVLFSACGQEPVEMEMSEPEVVLGPIDLNSFLTDREDLSEKVDSVFNSMSSESKVAQLIMPAAGRLGHSEERIKYLIDNNYIGGILLLNGTKQQFTDWVTEYNQRVERLGQLPFLYSADAEPSLVNRKIIGSKTVKKANLITSEEEVLEATKSISTDLNDIGINYNFSPVVDQAKNKTVGYRGFGTDPKNIVPYSDVFIQQTQAQNIIATAKHFPGHGLVSGDTHKSLQMIDGELKEVKYYPPLIENGVLSVMVGHLAVKNNKKYSTNGLPATTSKVIIQDLLRDSLNFKGLIVTDAMGMGGVVKIPNADVKAIAAGCDIILMPKDAEKAHKAILEKYTSDETFTENVNASVKRIIRMKICLGLI
ncbi:MAG: glycoside hydrolase family 3 N-terminal domain-containing protein [Crocinitomicaceae bacterium]|nr:glycoside hydrolase family 3 N-terminal domain-containing protein [Crocinitomicaceae bacterium]